MIPLIEGTYRREIHTDSNSGGGGWDVGVGGYCIIDPEFQLGKLSVLEMDGGHTTMAMYLMHTLKWLKW